MRLFPPTQRGGVRTAVPEWFNLMCEKYGEPEDVCPCDKTTLATHACYVNVVWTYWPAPRDWRIHMMVDREVERAFTRYKVKIYHGASTPPHEAPVARVTFTYTHITDDQMLALFNVVGVRI